MSSCEHLNTSICQKEATVVCLDCALVITENLSYDEVYIKKEHDTATFQDLEMNICPKIKTFIHEICHRLNIYDVVIPIIIKKFIKLQKKNNKFEKKLVAVYSIYSTLKKENCARSMKTLSYHTGISTKLIWIVERYFEERNHPLTPSQILSTYYTYLDFDYTDLQKMKKMIESTKIKKDFAPTTIAGGTICLYSQENNKKYNVKTIADLICTSPMSIYRYVNSIKRNK